MVLNIAPNGGRTARRLAWIVVALAGLPSGARPGIAQTTSRGIEHDVGLWFTALAQGSFAPLSPDLTNLLWWLEGQARFLDDSDFDQALIRPALGWAFAVKVSAWLGYTYVHTDAPGRVQFDEQQVWQQFLWSTRFAAVGFTTRTRLEERFLSTGSDVGWLLRQFFKATYPFGSRSRLGLAGFEEAFFNLNDTDWGATSGFAQNRLFVGLYWRIDEKPRTTLEAGYMNQYLNNIGRRDRMNNILMMNFLLNLN